jgi:hypothetical protein
MHQPTSEILETHPNLPDALPTVTNEAVATFLRSHVDVDIKHLTNSVERKDGLGLLLRLKTIYASATLADQQHALTNLQSLAMHPKESMTSFVSRFRKTQQHLHHATADASLLPKDKSLVIMFVQKLKDNSNLTPDIRQQVNALELDSLCDTSTITLTSIEDKLCMVESLALQRSQPVRGHGGSGQPARQVTCYRCGEPGHAANRCRSNPSTSTHAHTANHANANPSTDAKTNKFRRPVKCFMCGGNHSLKDCKKCDEAEKERLYREKLGPRKTNDSCPTKKTAQHANNTQVPTTPPTATTPPPPEQANSAKALSVGQPSIRPGVRWAQANVATAQEPSDPQDSTLPHYVSMRPDAVAPSTSERCEQPEDVILPPLNIANIENDDDDSSLPGPLPRPSNNEHRPSSAHDEDSNSSMPQLSPPTDDHSNSSSSEDDDEWSLPELVFRPHDDDSSSSSDDDDWSLPELVFRPHNDDSSSSSDDDSSSSSNDDDYTQVLPSPLQIAIETANAARADTPIRRFNAPTHANAINAPENQVSSIRDWLLDSGASTHMTPNRCDLISNIEPSTAIVEVANGALIRAELRGTVRIRLTDIHDHN